MSLSSCQVAIIAIIGQSASSALGLMQVMQAPEDVEEDDFRMLFEQMERLKLRPIADTSDYHRLDHRRDPNWQNLLCQCTIFYLLG